MGYTVAKWFDRGEGRAEDDRVEITVKKRQSDQPEPIVVPVEFAYMAPYMVMKVRGTREKRGPGPEVSITSIAVDAGITASFGWAAGDAEPDSGFHVEMFGVRLGAPPSPHFFANHEVYFMTWFRNGQVVMEVQVSPPPMGVSGNDHWSAIKAQVRDAGLEEALV